MLHCVCTIGTTLPAHRIGPNWPDLATSELAGSAMLRNVVSWHRPFGTLRALRRNGLAETER